MTLRLDVSERTYVSELEGQVYIVDKYKYYKIILPYGVLAS